MELPVTKSGEQHVILAMANEGLIGPITWLDEHFKDIEHMSSAPNFTQPPLVRLHHSLKGNYQKQSLQKPCSNVI